MTPNERDVIGAIERLEAHADWCERDRTEEDAWIGEVGRDIRVLISYIQQASGDAFDFGVEHAYAPSSYENRRACGCVLNETHEPACRVPLHRAVNAVCKGE